MSKKNQTKMTNRSYNFGRKLDGTIATEEDWDKWRKEFFKEEEDLYAEYLLNKLDNM